jgi:general secretion pathway protein K
MKLHLKTMLVAGRPEDRRRGVALVTVLWVLTLLALIAASFATNTRTEVNLVRNMVESAKAEALAEAGLYQAIVGLMAEGDVEPWRVDETVYAWLFETGEIRVAIRDEGGKIDLNTGRDQILRALFLGIGLEQEESDALADAILDFRDADALRRLNGAEDSDYEDAGLDHDAKDAPFEMVEELQQVYGMTGEIYEQVASSLTVHSRRPAPDRRIATRLVATAIGGRDGTEEAEEADDEPQLGEVSPEDLSDTPSILRAGDSESRSGLSVYTIHAEGRMPSGAVYALEAVVRLGLSAEAPYRVHTWRRAKRELFDVEASEGGASDAEARDPGG